MRRAILALVILFTGIIVKSQEPNTLYFMDRVPQSTMLNPAFVPKCNFYFAIPGSNFHTDINIYPLKLNTIVPYDNIEKTPVIFMRNDETKNTFLNTLKDNNELYTDFQDDIAIFGFRIKDWYFNFNASTRAIFNFAYPKSLVETFLINGFDLNKTYDYSKLGISFNSYIEVGFGITRQINEYWTLGAKLKVLRGVANMRTNNNLFTIGTLENSDNIYVTHVKSDFSVDMTVPYVKVNQGDNLSLDSLVEKNKDYKIKIFENMGFAFDFGTTYSGIQNLVLSASVIDLGSISWKDNVSNLKLSSNFEFDGADLVVDSFSNALDKSFTALKDSFKFSTSNASYSTSLPTRIYVGAEYSLVRFFSLGLLSSTRIYDGLVSEQVTFSGNLKPTKMGMLSLSYSVIDNAAHTFGMGFSFRIPPTQFYFVWDNIPVHYAKYFIPYKMDRINLRFGMTWVFGCNGRVKKLKDKPMGWE